MRRRSDIEKGEISTHSVRPGRDVEVFDVSKIGDALSEGKRMSVKRLNLKIGKIRSLPNPK